MKMWAGICGVRSLAVNVLCWFLFVLETISLELAILARLTDQQGLAILLSALSSAGITGCVTTTQL